ncbi:MAG: metallophosphoesterase family protein [Candidatus Hydrogenedentes bacterium]|nr:metallophosphoesterase family protein [Candidatus Hydrogenedentota bacterium]
MIMAVFGDVRGNWPALDAVLGAVDEAGIHTLVNTGDIAVGCPWPNEAIACVRGRAIPSVQGVYDRAVVRFVRKTDSLRKRFSPAEFTAIQWAYANTRSEHVEFLRSLPKRQIVTVDGIPVFLCHGSPASPFDALREDSDVTRFRRAREQANTGIIVCGHSHRAFVRTVDGALFVNPGSVGVPAGREPRAHYAIIDTEHEPWSAEIRYAEYDAGLVDARLRDCGLERMSAPA